MGARKEVLCVGAKKRGFCVGAWKTGICIAAMEMVHDVAHFDAACDRDWKRWMARCGVGQT